MTWLPRLVIGVLVLTFVASAPTSTASILECDPDHDLTTNCNVGPLHFVIGECVHWGINMRPSCEPAETLA